jgi:transcriptional/translational regulatory protein YebC/TACO1
MTEVRILLSSHGAKVASQGSVLWGFTKTESGWQPQYEQAVPPAALEKIRAIKEELEAHEDVQSVTVNIRGL